MGTIILQVRDVGDSAPIPPGRQTGLTCTTEKVGDDLMIVAARYPEAGPARGYAGYPDRFIVPIGPCRYEVDIHGAPWHDDVPRAEDYTVTFREVGPDEPDTPYTPWDPAKEIARRLDRLERAILAMAEAGQDTDRVMAEITEIQSPEYRPCPPFYLQVFGQPWFIQGYVFPCLPDGRAAMCLAVIRSGWGDAGNVNLLFQVDAEGRPCVVWLEASCC